MWTAGEDFNPQKFPIRDLRSSNTQDSLKNFIHRRQMAAYALNGTV